ncbi:hypothetical protein AB0K25_12990 [Micromonospora sp. NPDC049257]|uniref:hypothetical protein n=1 Tax=Micromonospora sp. NPDC049257 TaxID=3155771 RepID=UPI0034264F78
MLPPPGASGSPIAAKDSFDVPVFTRWSGPDLKPARRPMPSRVASVWRPWPGDGSQIPASGDYLVTTTWRDVLDAALSVGRDPTAWLTAVPALAWSEIVARRSPLVAYLCRSEILSAGTLARHIVEPNVIYTSGTEDTAQSAFGYRIGMTMAEWACRGLMGLGPTLHAEARAPLGHGPAWTPSLGLPDLIGYHPATGLPWIVEAKGGRRLGLPRLREGAAQLCRPDLMTGPHVKVLCGTSLTDRLFMTIDVENHDPGMSLQPGQAEAAETDRILMLAQSRMLTYFSLRALPTDSLRVLPIGPGVEDRRSRRGSAATVTLLEDDESTQVERRRARQDPSYLQRPGEHRLDMLTGAVPGTDLVLGMSRRLYAACEELALQQEQIAVMVDQEIPRPRRDQADDVADQINAARRQLLYQEVGRSEARYRTREAFESAQSRNWWSLIDRPARLTPEPEQNVLEAATEDTYLALDARTAELAMPREV